MIETKYMYQYHLSSLYHFILVLRITLYNQYQWRIQGGGAEGARAPPLAVHSIIAYISLCMAAS